MSRRVALTTVAAAPATEVPFLDASPVLTQGKQTYIDKVKELEARFKPKTKRSKSKKKKTNKRKKKVCSPKKRAFNLSDIIKGRQGVVVRKGTTLRSLVRHVGWGKTPRLQFLPHVKLVDGQYLNKRTTLLSLVKHIPMSRQPLIDLIGNKSV